MKTRIVLPLLLCGLAIPAVASNGVMEINNACVQVGCFAGDAAGYPVTLTAAAGSSYLLTGSLTPPDGSVAISVQVDGTKIDLNGFSILFSEDSYLSSEVAIEAPTADGTIVQNGFFNRSVSLRADSVVRDSVFRSDDRSLRVTAGTVVRNEIHSLTTASVIASKRVSDNNIIGDDGYDHVIRATKGTVITGNLVRTGATVGISCTAGSSSQAGCLIEGNTVDVSEGVGIIAEHDVIVRNNTVHTNSSGGGIIAKDGALIVDNVVDGGSCIGGSAVEVGRFSMVRGNYIFSSCSALELDTGSGYSGNNLRSGPPPVVGGIDLGGNICNGNTTCP